MADYRCPHRPALPRVVRPDKYFCLYQRAQTLFAVKALIEFVILGFMVETYLGKGVIFHSPESAVRRGRGIRKLLIPRLNHGIFYALERLRIMVAAVIDLRRDPEYVRSRIGI